MEGILVRIPYIFLLNKSRQQNCIGRKSHRLTIRQLALLPSVNLDKVVVILDTALICFNS